MVRLAEQTGCTLRWWTLDRETQDCTLAGLDAVLNERTRLVAAVHVSNLLGQVADVAAIAEHVHAANPAASVPANRPSVISC